MTSMLSRPRIDWFIYLLFCIIKLVGSFLDVNWLNRATSLNNWYFYNWQFSNCFCKSVKFSFIFCWYCLISFYFNCLYWLKFPSLTAIICLSLFIYCYFSYWYFLMQTNVSFDLINYGIALLSSFISLSSSRGSCFWAKN